MRKKFNLHEHPHRRLNLLNGEWVLVSPQRSKRPWQGQVEDIQTKMIPQYDPDCYLCPGNTRAGGKINPEYTGTFVFDNDFSALQLDTPESGYNNENLLLANGEPGICRVVCFSPRHDLTLPEMNTDLIVDVIKVWTEQYRELGKMPEINYVQIFENKGNLMGCSNPHPHGQIWAEASIPVEPAKEHQQLSEYWKSQKSCLLCDYLKLENQQQERIVFENDDFLGLVPFWAVWPFETLLLPKRHFSNILEMKDSEKISLAGAIREMTIRYDNLFKTSFPYSSGFHQSPTNGQNHPAWHFHMHFYPPLLRSASVKKFMVGYEMLANPQRDITPEWSAENLRNVPDIHYIQ